MVTKEVLHLSASIFYEIRNELLYISLCFESDMYQINTKFVTTFRFTECVNPIHDSNLTYHLAM